MNCSISFSKSQTEPCHCMGQQPGPAASPLGYDGNLFQVVKTLQALQVSTQSTAKETDSTPPIK